MFLSQLNKGQVFTFPKRRGEYIFESVITTGSGKYALYHSKRMGTPHIEFFHDAERIEVTTNNN